MGPVVEPVPPPSGAVRPASGWTERGLWGLVVALGVALGTDLLELSFLATAFGPPSFSSPGLLFAVEDVAGVAVVGTGLAGFWWLRRGRDEQGAAHASNLRRATVALFGAVASELLLVLTGLALGYGLLPSAVVIGETYPPTITVEWVIQTVHFAAYSFIAAFVGLFLLWNVWQLAPRLLRGTALAALLLALPGPILSLTSVAELVDPRTIPFYAFYASWILTSISGSLWLLAYLLLAVRVRGAAQGTPAEPAVPEA